MVSLEPEITRLRDDGALEPAAAARLIAIERREVFSVHHELRLLAWVAVTLLVTGLGILLHRNFQNLGPLFVLLSILTGSAACYGFVIWRQRKKHPSTLVDDSALLLAALLLSAAIGYGESVWHLLDDHWSWHLILIAMLHGFSAYYFASRVLLSLSITALAGFLGINYNPIHTNLFVSHDLALRGYICAGTLFAWRTLNLRVSARREFTEVFDHVIAILTLVSALILVFEDDSRIAGLLLLLPAVTGVFFYGWRNRSQSFVVYAVIALLIGLGNVIAEALGNETVVLLYVLVSTIAAIVFLFMVRSRFREDL